MLHPLIIQLNQRRPLAHWLFLLTAYEIGGKNWQPRVPIVEACQMHPNSVKNLITKLIRHGDIVQRYVPASDGGNHAQIRLTDQALLDLKVAFKLAQASEPQPIAA